MRTQNLKSLPAAPVDGTLLFGDDPIPCYIVSASDEGFCVAVPGVEQYEGSPNLALQTSEASYLVKLVRQDAHAGGYSYILRKIDSNSTSDMIPNEESVPAGNTTQKPNVSDFRFNVAGTIVSMAAGMFLATFVGGRMSCFNLKKIGEGLANTSSRLNDAQRPQSQTSITSIPEMSAVPTELISTPIQKEVAEPVEVSSVSSTLTSNTNVVESSAQQKSAEMTPTMTAVEDRSPVNRPVRSKKSKGPNLLFDSSRVGEFQDLTRSVYPWLFEQGPIDNRSTIRFSDAARFDLKQFEQGLHELTATGAMQAVASLQRTFNEALSISKNVRRVAGSKDLYVISSDDAKIYFRRARDRMDVIRVLPIDFDGEE